MIFGQAYKTDPIPEKGWDLFYFFKIFIYNKFYIVLFSDNLRSYLKYTGKLGELQSLHQIL